MLNRKLYNIVIVEKLKELVNKYPDLRFGQILANAEVVIYKNDYDEMVPIDPYYEEPEVTWERMKNSKFVFND